MANMMHQQPFALPPPHVQYAYPYQTQQQGALQPQLQQQQLQQQQQQFQQEQQRLYQEQQLAMQQQQILQQQPVGTGHHGVVYPPSVPMTETRRGSSSTALARHDLHHRDSISSAATHGQQDLRRGSISSLHGQTASMQATGSPIALPSFQRSPVLGPQQYHQSPMLLPAQTPQMQPFQSPMLHPMQPTGIMQPALNRSPVLQPYQPASPVLHPHQSPVLQPTMAHSPAIPAMDQEMYQYEAMQGDPGMEAVVMPGSRRGSTASTIARALVGTGAATSLTAADIARDMKLLREVLKEKRPDDKVLIQILGFATPEQCHQLALAYKGYYGVALPEALKHSLSGSFGKMCVALATPLPDYDAMWVHDAVSGIGTNEDILMEILVGRSNAEIKAIMHSYKMIYGKDLEQVIGSELKHHLKKLFVVLLQAQRDETGQILDVEEDVEALFQAAKSRSHKDQCVFISTLCNRSDAHLLTMFEAYHRKHGITVEELIKKEFRGDLEKSMLALVHSIQNRPAHVADLFNQAIHGGHFGKPDDDKLIRLTVRHRHPRVMALVREAYAAVWGQSLYRKVEDATKGEFRRLLLACIGLDRA